MRRRFLAMLLCIAMLLLTACGEDKNSNTNTKTLDNATPTVSMTKTDVTEPVVVTTTEKVDDPVVATTTEKIDEPVVMTTTEKVDDPVVVTTTEKVDDPVVATTTKTVDKNDEDALYTRLFDINNVITVKIDISDEELAKIQKDYKIYSSIGSKSPIYRKADKVTITIGEDVYEIEEVGIRMKGNTSRTSFYEDKEGVVNLIHYRLSFSETFDDEEQYGNDVKVWTSPEERDARKDRTFATLENLELKWNKNYDATHICEYYAYSLFRDFGVLAPHVNLAQIKFGDKNFGVFSLYEPVDKIFIKRYVAKEDRGGDLYKVAWTNVGGTYTNSVSYGVEDEDIPRFYNFDLKTNKKTSTHDDLSTLLFILNSGNVTKEEFESFVDVDYWVNFAAASYFTGNPDDMRNNYNNHYVYFLKSTGKAIFIPYDYDRTLGINKDWNPSGSGMTDVSPFSDRAVGNNFSEQVNPLFKYSILEGGYFVQEYKNALEQIANSKWLNFNEFKTIYEIARVNYQNRVIPNVDFWNANEQGFAFSINGTRDCGSGDNIAVDEYMKRILEAYRKSIK